MSNIVNYFPGDKEQFIVQTPYGEGLVVRTREGELNENQSNSDGSSSVSTVNGMYCMKEIRLLDWESAMKSGNISRKMNPRNPTMLYSPIEYPSVPVKKGDDVLTPFGRGRVIELIRVTIRKKRSNSKGHEEKVQVDCRVNGNGSSDERILTKFHVQITSWRLAGRSNVNCFLFKDQVRAVRKKTLGEMDVQERIEFAIIQKKSATAIFGEKQYQRALNLYSGAIDAVRFVQHDTNSSNECRADLLEILITCSNNAATCCLKLKRWEQARRFAKNALVLLDALYDKRGLKIHGILQRDNGLCDAKLFGEWRLKSHSIIARTMTESDEYEEACLQIQAAKDIYTEFTSGEELERVPSDVMTRLENQQRELLKLKDVCGKKRRALLKKEKARARAMFRESNTPPNPVPVSKDDSIFRQKKADQDSTKTKGVSSKSEVDEATTKNKIEANEEHCKNQVKTATPADRTVNKKVSFASELEEQHIIEDEEEAWYNEHKEALILMGIGGLAALSIVLGLRRGNK